MQQGWRRLSVQYLSGCPDSQEQGKVLCNRQTAVRLAILRGLEHTGTHMCCVLPAARVSVLIRTHWQSRGYVCSRAVAGSDM